MTPATMEHAENCDVPMVASAMNTASLGILSRVRQMYTGSCSGVERKSFTHAWDAWANDHNKTLMPDLSTLDLLTTMDPITTLLLPYVSEPYLLISSLIV